MAQQIWLVIIMTKFVGYYIMDGRAFVVAKEAFIMETVVFWYCDNVKMMKNNSFSVNAINVKNHLYSAINLNHVKLRYIEPCNFLTKRALVSQQSTLAVAKDPNILHYFNQSCWVRLTIYDTTHTIWQ